MNFWKQFSIIFLSFLHFCHGGNILIFQAVCSYSHRVSMWPLVTDLIEHGHNVTAVSPFPLRGLSHPKFNDYIPKVWSSALGDWSDAWDFLQDRKDGQGWKIYRDAATFGLRACQSLYDDEEFVEWIRSNKFDLVIVDHSYNECVFGMIHYWQAKLIMYSTNNVQGWYQEMFGLPDETSSITETGFGFPPEMSFKQRFINALLPLAFKIQLEWLYFPELEKVTAKGLEKVTGSRYEMPPFAEFEREYTSLIFITSHYSMSYPRSHPPNHIQIGGMLPEKAEKLPKDLEDFIGKDPFIFISLGSVTEFTKFADDAQKQFIAAIAAFPEVKFVWKEGMEPKFKLPKNVKLVQWAPQFDLLGSKNVKCFITHSGQGSTMEAIKFGVPLIMFPLFTDQDMNADVVASRGAGIKLEITDIQQATFEDAIRQILHNPSYSQNMQKLSKFFKDRPMAPGQTARWWIEFVLRHDHSDLKMLLRPASVLQPWWVKRQIDVWLVATTLLIAVIIVSVFLVKSVVKFAMRCLFKNDRGKSKMKPKVN